MNAFHSSSYNRVCLCVCVGRLQQQGVVVVVVVVVPGDGDPCRSHHPHRRLHFPSPQGTVMVKQSNSSPLIHVDHGGENIMDRH